MNFIQNLRRTLSNLLQVGGATGPQLKRNVDAIEAVTGAVGDATPAVMRAATAVGPTDLTTKVQSVLTDGTNPLDPAFAAVPPGTRWDVGAGNTLREGEFPVTIQRHDVTVYWDSFGGSDLNNGLSPTTPVLTFDRAWVIWSSQGVVAGYCNLQVVQAAGNMIATVPEFTHVYKVPQAVGAVAPVQGEIGFHPPAIVGSFTQVGPAGLTPAVVILPLTRTITVAGLVVVADELRGHRLLGTSGGFSGLSHAVVTNDLTGTSGAGLTVLTLSTDANTLLNANTFILQRPGTTITFTGGAALTLNGDGHGSGVDLVGLAFVGAAAGSLLSFNQVNARLDFVSLTDVGLRGARSFVQAAPTNVGGVGQPLGTKNVSCALLAQSLFAFGGGVGALQVNDLSEISGYWIGRGPTADFYLQRDSTSATFAVDLRPGPGFATGPGLVTTDAASLVLGPKTAGYSGILAATGSGISVNQEATANLAFVDVSGCVGDGIITNSAGDLTVNQITSALAPNGGAGARLQDHTTMTVFSVTPTITGALGDVLMPGQPGVATGSITWLEFTQLITPTVLPSSTTPAAIIPFSGGFTGAAVLVTAYFANVLPGALAFLATPIRFGVSDGRVLSYLRVRVEVGGNTLAGITTFTLYKNGVATAMTVTVGAGATGTFANTTHAVAYKTGDDYSLVATETGLGTLACTATVESTTG